MKEQKIVVCFLSLIKLTRAEFYLVERETDEETDKQPSTIAKYCIDISRKASMDKTDHANETVRHT